MALPGSVLVALDAPPFRHFSPQARRRALSMTSGGRPVPRWTYRRSAWQGSRWRSTPSAMRESRSCEMHRACFVSANGWSVSFRRARPATTMLRGRKGWGRGWSLYLYSLLGPSRRRVGGMMCERGSGRAEGLLVGGCGSFAWWGCVGAPCCERTLCGPLMALLFFFYACGLSAAFHRHRSPPPAMTACGQERTLREGRHPA